MTIGKTVKIAYVKTLPHDANLSPPILNRRGNESVISCFYEDKPDISVQLNFFYSI